jgi:rhodanese-related sulfurtransferase
MKPNRYPVTLRIIFILVMAMTLAASVAWLRRNDAHHRPAHWFLRETDAATVMADPAAWLILDARPEPEYLEGHIAGALSLGDHNWDEGLGTFLERWNPETPVLVYCGGQACGTSKHVALRLLEDLPDIKVFVLHGGYPAWLKQQT